MDIKEFSSKEAETVPQAPGILRFDAEKYLVHVDDMEMTDAQKMEFLRTLWTIMSAFVDLGFGVDSVMPILAQRALENGCGTVKENIPTHEFNVAADEDPAGKADQS
jgi:homoserine acetyltransferase